MNLFNSTGKRARWIGTALLLTTFVAGALAGAASERVMRADDPPAPRERSPEMRGGSRRLLLDEQFAKELQLTAEQRTQLKAIMDRRESARRECRQRFAGERFRAALQHLYGSQRVMRSAPTRIEA